MCCTVRQLADAISGMLRQALHAPGLRKFLAVLRELDVLIARIGIRQRAHITRTLHVILTTNRVHADMCLAKITGQHGEAGQRTHGFHALIELGNAHAPQNSGGFRPRVHPCCLADLLGADPSNRFNRFWRVAFNNFPVLFKPFRTGGDERLVVQVFLNNDVPHRIQQRDIRTVFQCDVHIRNARSFNFTRIADDDFRPILFGANNVIRDDRVRIRRVITENKHEIGVIYLVDCIAHCAVTDRLVQTCNRWAVSDASAAVDVIGTNNGAREFLHYIVGFITRTA